MALAQTFENSANSSTGSPTLNHDPHPPPPLTPSEALRLKYQHVAGIQTLAAQFGAKIVDMSENSVIVELTGKSSRVEAFLSLLQPFGILESARTGLMVMPRTPIHRKKEQDTPIDEGGEVDASLLPPG
jgi:acetolactate synthase-1/3 small subunit